MPKFVGLDPETIDFIMNMVQSDIELYQHNEMEKDESKELACRRLFSKLKELKQNVTHSSSSS